MTDYKQLCAELLAALEEEASNWNLDPECHPLVVRARAALAQPEPKGPHVWTEAIYGDGAVFLKDGVMVPIEEVVRELNRGAQARAVLARWGNHPGFPNSSTPQPVVGEVAELVELIRQNVALAWEPAACMLGNMTAGELTRAAELLEQLNPPQPVPVSERLPLPGDCDEEGRCWWWYPEVPGKTYGYWAYEDDAVPERALNEQPTHWLPAHALLQPS